MKLFYLSAIDDLDYEKCGILGKVYGQIHAFEQKEIHVSFGHFHGRDTFVINSDGNDINYPVKKGNTRKRLGSVYNKLRSYIITNGIGVLYVRFTSLDYRTIKFYRELHDSGVKVIIEFYSHNLELEAKKTVIRDFKNKYFLRAVKELISLTINRHYFFKLKSCVDLIVTTTPIDDMYGIHTINVVNGIDIDNVSVREKITTEYDLDIISVAMISPWHGYDRVINGIADYYKNGGKANIMYTVIGDGEEKANLEQMVSKLNLQKHVVFTGIKLGEELNPYYDKADIALEMLAGFRRTSGQISSIKMAEYFAKGIPVVYAADKPLYATEMERYCYRVENNDSSIDIEALIHYCKDVYTERDVQHKMHEIAKSKFDWSITAQALHRFILNGES